MIGTRALAGQGGRKLFFHFGTESAQNAPHFISKLSFTSHFVPWPSPTILIISNFNP
jgi:hypothetical protein